MAWTSPPRSSHSAVRSYNANEAFPPEEEAALAFSDRRTLYLVNIFVADTVRFLNRFSSICEEKLADVHRRMLRLDATLTLLEAKLRSIDQDEVYEDHGPSNDAGSSTSSFPVASSSSIEDSLDLPSGSECIIEGMTHIEVALSEKKTSDLMFPCIKDMRYIQLHSLSLAQACLPGKSSAVFAIAANFTGELTIFRFLMQFLPSGNSSSSSAEACPANKGLNWRPNLKLLEILKRNCGSLACRISQIEMSVRVSTRAVTSRSDSKYKKPTAMYSLNSSAKVTTKKRPESASTSGPRSKETKLNVQSPPELSETGTEETDLSSSEGDDSTWISWFCGLRGNELLCEVDEDYIQDDFNLCGLQGLVSYYDYALDMILDNDSLSGDMDGEEHNEIESAAELLYGLIHARYILTAKGLNAMHEKYKRAGFGRCPRVFCGGQPCLPVGISDIPRNSSVKIYCPKCEDIYLPRCKYQSNMDGAYVGTTFPHLYLMTYPSAKPAKPVQTYVPRVFGFKVHRGPTR